MKFNTIIYDANLPTVQQVNVPTNSDYKVGMKVKRNGEVQSIKPSEYTIYTGEINVIPPTDYTSTTKTCEDASSMNLLSLKEADLSALAGQRIKYTDVYVEFSFDNGTTWSKLVPEVNSVMVQVNNRAGGTNNYIARLDLRRQNQKWAILDHNVPTGEVADYVTIPETARMMIQFLGSDWGSLTYPCLWRFVFLYGGYEERVTYPVDQEKTNGYVTITKASGDEATFKQYGVHINHGYDFNDVYRRTGQFPATNPGYDYAQIKVLASELGIVGCLADGEGFAEGHVYSYRNASTPPPADLSAWSKSDWNINSWEAPYQVGFEGETNVYVFHTSPLTHPVGWTLPDGSTCDSDGYWFIDYKAGDPSYTNIRKYWVLTENSYIYHRGTGFKANQYFGQGAEFKVGTPFSADFKLNINEFKSQSGDIAETLADGSSVKVDGTFADGTDFSFDFCTK